MSVWVSLSSAIAEEISPLGIEIRAGLHTGECEMMGEDVGGIAVQVGFFINKSGSTTLRQLALASTAAKESRSYRCRMP
ncbi:hypothetical protein [Rhizobium sp. NXC24]|uniref:hypothetical protein n=1 Tax=Rhizobium sp. NXC24 TaxID=2048897 RepID=UPI000CDF341A|nr:hypothetical protein [Rhizobium sp. NXC24]AVA26503.1 hypothetical protein NXC24_PC02077 [Rhizobium sp. NXC24]